MHERLNMYVLAASGSGSAISGSLAAYATGVGLLALTPLSQAKIIYTPAHVVLGFNSNATRGRYSLDLNHDGEPDFSLQADFSATGCWNVSFIVAGDLRKNRIVGKDRGAAALRNGVRIAQASKIYGLMAGSAGCSRTSTIKFFGPWANGGKGVKNRYLGLKFHIHGKVHYGWARLTVAFFKGWTPTATLTGYAYETIPNKPILAGQEQGKNEATLGHLATGASAIPAWRVKPAAATTH
jgi:hypothetical protein